MHETMISVSLKPFPTNRVLIIGPKRKKSKGENSFPLGEPRGEEASGERILSGIALSPVCISYARHAQLVKEVALD